MEQQLFKVAEAARLLRVSKLFLYESVKSELVPVVRMGRRVFIARTVLDRLLREGLPSQFQRTEK